MTQAKWSPTIERVMHELSNAAPSAPTTASLREGQTPPSRQPRIALTFVAAAAAVATVVGLIVVVSGDDKSSVSGPMSTIDVHHTRIQVTLDAQLECDTQIDTSGKFATMVIDSYSDRSGLQWRTNVTYPDGSTVDFIARGSAIYPTGRFQRGDYLGSSFGCIGPEEERFALVSEPFRGGFFSLNLVDELAPDERPFVREFSEVSKRVDGDHFDSLGRLSELWEQRTEGTAGYGSVETFDVVQVSSWWVDATDGRTVTERRFSNDVEQLGSATETLTLVLNESLTVPDDFFDTTGYQQLETFPRPSLDGSPTDDTVVSAMPNDSNSDTVLLPDPATSDVQVISHQTYGALAETWGAVLAPDRTVFGFVLHRPASDSVRTDGERRIIEGHGVHAVADGSAPAEIYRTIANSCATLVVTTAEEEAWSINTVALLASLTFAGAKVTFDLPAGWTDLGSSPARPQHIMELSVNSHGEPVQLVLQQMAGVPVGFFLSTSETAPRPTPLEGSTAWVIDSATTPGWRFLIGERDGIAFALSGMLSASDLTEVALTLRTTKAYSVDQGDFALVMATDTTPDPGTDCDDEPTLTVVPFVAVLPDTQQETTTSP